MILGFSLQLLLIGVLCSLLSCHNGVNAQEPYTLFFPPPIIIHEGEDVTLACTATNLQSLQAGYYIEWARIYPSGRDVILASNGTSHDPRISLAIWSTSQSRNERITISNITKEENNFKCRCRLKDKDDNYLSNSSGSFYVRFFPDDMYPVCTPAGEFTVQPGTTQMLSCTTEKSRPLAQMAITTTGGDDVVSDWTFTEDAVTYEGKYSKEQTWTENVRFTCTLTSSSFPNKNSSCYIGPVNLHDVTYNRDTMTTPPKTLPETTPSTSSAPDMISKFRSLALLVISFSLFIIVLFR